jgi:hypothetical protein
MVRQIGIWVYLILLVCTFASACEQLTLKSGYDIPAIPYSIDFNNITEDQIEIEPFQGTFSYHNPAIKNILVLIGSGTNIYHVLYRRDIPSKSGQVVYNLIEIWKPSNNIDTDNITLRLNNIYSDISIKRFGISTKHTNHNQTALLINIDPKAKPGDYRFEILVFANSKYINTIPFFIHITSGILGGSQVIIIRAPL